MTTEAAAVPQEKDDAQPNQAERTRMGRFFRPRVDILEKPDELLLLADMPGVKSNELDIQFDDGELTIHGPVGNRRSDEAGLLLEEYGVGDFYRTFRVSEQIDPTKIQAEYAQGVLTVHLPKVEAAKPRKISVNVK